MIDISSKMLVSSLPAGGRNQESRAKNLDTGVKKQESIVKNQETRDLSDYLGWDRDA